MDKMFEFVSHLKKRGEQGWSLTSTLVAVALTVVVGVVVVAIVVSAQKTSSQFTDTVMTEGELNNAVSEISKQLTTADAILYADDDILKVSGTVKDEKRETTFFAWSPTESDIKEVQKASSDLKISDLPDFPAIVSYSKVFNGDTEKNSEVKVLVNGYVPADSFPLFSYFDKDDADMDTAVPEASLSAIQRVQVVIKASVEGREAPMEVATSVTPRGGDSGTVGEEWEDDSDPLSAPVLKGTIAPRERDTHLSWNFVDKAESYTLYYKPQYSALMDASYSVAGTTTDNKFTHKGLKNGMPYDYYVVANNGYGSSAISNVVNLTVNPEAPKISGAVQEDFTNKITFAPRFGANGYRIIRDGVTVWTSKISEKPDYLSGMATQVGWVDDKAKAGESHTYKAVAFNSLGTGKNTSLGNGDSFWSNEVTLFANPEAPNLTGSVSKGDRNLKWNSVKGASGYQLERISPEKKSFSDQTTVTRTDNDKIVSDSFKYRVRAKTPVGYGDWSNTVDLNPQPEPVQPVVSDYTDSATSYNLKNKIVWPSSKEATDYDFSQGSGWNNVGNTLNRFEAAGADSKTTYKVRACNYTGCSDYKYDIGLQPPGPFKVTGHSENARKGYSSTRTDANMKLSAQNATFSWDASAGANSYTYNGAGGKGTTSSRSFKTTSYTPGSSYTVAVTSKGDTSGLTRTGTSYKWQAAPAQPYNVRFRMQYKGESDGDTRISMWSSKYGPKTGSATRVEMRSGLRYRTSSKAEYGFSGRGWDKWSKTIYTDSFNKAYTSTRETGGIGWARSVKTVPAGYHGTSKSQDSHSKLDWTVTGNNNKAFEGGYLGIYGGTSVANSNNWTNSSGSKAGKTSSWTNVTYSPTNYPMNYSTKNYKNWYGIDSR